MMGLYQTLNAGLSKNISTSSASLMLNSSILNCNGKQIQHCIMTVKFTVIPSVTGYNQILLLYGYLFFITVKYFLFLFIKAFWLSVSLTCLSRYHHSSFHVCALKVTVSTGKIF